MGAGSEIFIELAKQYVQERNASGNDAKVRVLEIGPGKGELTPEMLRLGCSMTNIGEEAHNTEIYAKYKDAG